jgi:hypothetical protein
MKSFIFSAELIDETVQCFKIENKLDISIEQANEYLNSLSGLYLSFAGGRAMAKNLSSKPDTTTHMGLDN